MRGYILIKTDVGKAAGVVQAVRAITGVISCDPVTGPYDAIATVESSDLDSLGKMVVSQVQAVDGVWRTLTCPAVRL